MSSQCDAGLVLFAARLTLFAFWAFLTIEWGIFTYFAGSVNNACWISDDVIISNQAEIANPKCRYAKSHACLPRAVRLTNPS